MTRRRGSRCTRPRSPSRRWAVWLDDLRAASPAMIRRWCATMPPVFGPNLRRKPFFILAGAAAELFRRDDEENLLADQDSDRMRFAACRTLLLETTGGSRRPRSWSEDDPPCRGEAVDLQHRIENCLSALFARPRVARPRSAVGIRLRITLERLRPSSSRRGGGPKAEGLASEFARCRESAAVGRRW